MAGKRSIFEEVGAGSAPKPTGGGMIDAPAKGARGAIRAWLAVLFLMVAAMIAGALLGYRGLVTTFTGFRGSGLFEEALFHLANLGSATGIALAIVLAIRIGFSVEDLAPEAERWRGALGFIAVLLLFLENPGEVLFERWSILSLIFFPLILVAFTLRESLRQGAALGLACIVGGSLISQAALWLIGAGWSSTTFTSVPRFLALFVCLAAMAPKSLFDNSNGIRPFAQ